MEKSFYTGIPFINRTCASVADTLLLLLYVFSKRLSLQKLHDIFVTTISLSLGSWRRRMWWWLVMIGWSWRCWVDSGTPSRQVAHRQKGTRKEHAKHVFCSECLTNASSKHVPKRLQIIQFCFCSDKFLAGRFSVSFFGGKTVSLF